MKLADESTKSEATKMTTEKKSQRVLQVGNKVLIRTVTHYLTGLVVEIGDNMVTLTDAAWIASTGRFSDALRTGVLDEIEPCGTTDVGLGGIIDVNLWNHDLPTVQK